MTLRACALLLFTCAATFCALQPALAEARGHGMDRYPFDDLDRLAPAADFPPWADMMRRRALEPWSLEACLGADASTGMPAACPPALRGARTVVLRGRSLMERDRLELVNRFVDRRRYLATANDNRWETLASFLRRGGDCEDFALAKYFLLRAMGMPAANLRVVVAHTRGSSGNHALLAVRLADGQALLLDTDDRMHPASRSGPYRYLYSVNEDALWDHAGRDRVQTLSGARRGHVAGAPALASTLPASSIAVLPSVPLPRGEPP